MNICTVHLLNLQNRGADVERLISLYGGRKMQDKDVAVLLAFLKSSENGLKDTTSPDSNPETSHDHQKKRKADHDLPRDSQTVLGALKAAEAKIEKLEDSLRTMHHYSKILALGMKDAQKRDRDTSEIELSRLRGEHKDKIEKAEAEIVHLKSTVEVLKGELLQANKPRPNLRPSTPEEDKKLRDMICHDFHTASYEELTDDFVERALEQYFGDLSLS